MNNQRKKQLVHDLLKYRGVSLHVVSSAPQAVVPKIPGMSTTASPPPVAKFFDNPLSRPPVPVIPIPSPLPPLPDIMTKDEISTITNFTTTFTLPDIKNIMTEDEIKTIINFTTNNLKQADQSFDRFLQNISCEQKDTEEYLTLNIKFTQGNTEKVASVRYPKKSDIPYSIRDIFILLIFYAFKSFILVENAIENIIEYFINTGIGKYIEKTILIVFFFALCMTDERRQFKEVRELFSKQPQFENLRELYDNATFWVGPTRHVGKSKKIDENQKRIDELA